jgi:hypothetical protein
MIFLKKTHGPDLGRSGPACWVPARFAHSARERYGQPGLPGGAWSSGLYLYPKGYAMVRSRSNGPTLPDQIPAARTEDGGGGSPETRRRVAGVGQRARRDVLLGRG